MTVLEQQIMETIMKQLKEMNKNLKNINSTLEKLVKGGENNDK